MQMVFFRGQSYCGSVTFGRRGFRQSGYYASSSFFVEFQRDLGQFTLAFVKILVCFGCFALLSQNFAELIKGHRVKRPLVQRPGRSTESTFNRFSRQLILAQGDEFRDQACLLAQVTRGHLPRAGQAIDGPSARPAGKSSRSKVLLTKC